MKKEKKKEEEEEEDNACFYGEDRGRRAMRHSRRNSSKSTSQGLDRSGEDIADRGRSRFEVRWKGGVCVYGMPEA